MGYLTPNELGGDVIVCITIPADPLFKAALIGAITSLMLGQEWEKFGTLTPEEAAQEMTDRYPTLTFQEV